MNLNSEIDLSQFFSWWGGELSAFLPQKFRERLSRGKGFLVVELHAGLARVEYVDRERVSFLGTFPPNALAREEINDLIESEPLYKDAECVLRVPEKLTIKQDVYLPIAAEGNIKQALTYELDRYTPFNKDQVYFDYIKLDQENNKTHLHLLLLLVKKETLDEMYQAAIKLGFKPSFSDSAAHAVVSGKASSRYNLLAENLCEKENKKSLYIMLGALLLTLALFATMLFYPLYKLDQGLEKLKQHAGLVEKAAMHIDDTKKGIDHLYSATEKVIIKKKEHASMIDVINKATEILNDDTWVSQLRYVNNKLELTGQSKSASSLIASFEDTELFHNTKFISPVTKDNRTGKERFKISTEVKNN